ncbi:MAG: histidine kinase [Henriciella sp.]|nr:histidine kinase [Henriciella sp.]MBF33768.1 histidine kinase [Hyphomonadaceae bacterium]MBK76829.1 histidine kinase [Henriciella sp.]PHR76440.1 MAG: histidine kinase [Henriciella sp.]|tara:strand:- start:3729 stop:4256 length:528 start_codon:yes stop_codon:yes gene_type:complete
MQPSLENVREAARLHCLRRMKILDSASDDAFDAITRAAARHFQTPIALVSLVDEKRQWFKSRVGLDVCETDREHSFCAHAVAMRDMFIVEDAQKDPRFQANPLVTGPPFIRFYAGAPINVNGYDLGTLCVIDTEPRTFSAVEQRELKRMAHLAKRQIKLKARMAGLEPVQALAPE